MEANLYLGPRSFLSDYLMSVGDVLREQTQVSTVMNASSDHGEVFLQQMWDYMRAKEVLQSPFLPASYAFLTHVLLCLPYLLLDTLGDFSPQVRQWRISAGPARPTLRQWVSCFGRVLRAYLTAVLPLTALLQVLRSPVLPEHAPSCWQLVVEVSVCLLLFDAFFFAWHFCMHK